MPIARELRHLYTTPAWEAMLALLRKRSKNRCEWCGKPNHQEIWTRSGQGRMFWSLKGLTWRDQEGAVVTLDSVDWMLARTLKLRRIRVVLTGAHLNHVAGDDRPENCAYICQWHHLQHDLAHHVANSRATRKLHKDQARPLLQEAIA